MPGYDVTGPGAAFSDSMENFMAKRDLLARQRLLDDLATKREDRLMQAELEHAQEKRDALKSLDQSRQDAHHDRLQKEAEDALKAKESAYQKRKANMVPGDIPDAEMLAMAKDLKVGGVDFPVQPESGSTTLPGTAIPLGRELVNPDAPESRPYVGNHDDRVKADLTLRRQQYVDSLPDTDPRKAQWKADMQAETLGLKVPTAGGAGHTRYIFDPITKTYSDPEGNKVTKLPADAVVDRSAEPKDHSAREAADAARVQSTREHGYKEVDDRVKGLEEQITNIDKLRVGLDQNSNVADASIMPQLIKAVEGGAGSGVRMTTPLIQAELKGSVTAWESAKLATNRWLNAGGVDDKGNKVPLVLTDDQRAAVRKLIDALRKRALSAHQKAVAARVNIDNATTVDEVNHHRTAAQGDQFEPDPEPVVPASGGKVIRHDMNGNVIPDKP